MAVTGVLLASLASCDAGAHKSPSVSVPEVFYLRPAGDGSGPRDKAPFHLSADDGKVHADGRGATGHTLTADVLPGAETAVVLRRSGNCTGSATHVTCEVGAEYDNWLDAPRVSPVAARGSRPGAVGVVRFTYTDDSGRKATARTRAVVGEPVVEVLTPGDIRGVRPGAGLSEPIVIRNTGEVPVRGLGLEISANLLEFEEQYANCRYPGFSRGHTAVCAFPDLRIAPGETVVIRPALRLRTPKTQRYVSFGSDVWALDMGPGHYGSYPKGGDHGDGPALRAETTDAEKGTYTKGGGETDVVLDTYADYSVSDVDLYGAPGTERTFKITVRNNGPAQAGATENLVFSPPLGMTLVKQPMDEYDDGAYEPYCKSNGYTYTCAIHDLAPGDTQTLTFTMRLGDPGEGTLSLQDNGSNSEGDIGDQDPEPGNDEAIVRVHAEDAG